MMAQGLRKKERALDGREERGRLVGGGGVRVRVRVRERQKSRWSVCLCVCWQKRALRTIGAVHVCVCACMCACVCMYVCAGLR